jgi:hypothetical protein
VAQKNFGELETNMPRPLFFSLQHLQEIVGGGEREREREREQSSLQHACFNSNYVIPFPSFCGLFFRI